MASVILALVGVAVGIVAGLVFFGGLWWTSHRLVTSRRPGLLVALSLLVRMAVLATALVVLARVGVAMLAGGVGGVIVARMALTRAAVGGRLPEPGAGRGAAEARK